MKAVTFTLGTRGDVHPYIYLAHEMKKRRHMLTICSNPCWKNLVENAGVQFVPRKNG